MFFLGEIRRRARFVLAPLLGLGAIVYFSYHAVQGERGLLAWWETRHEIRQARTRLARLKKEHDALENRVRLLRPESLDRDLLEERARAVLNMGVEGDIVVVVPNAPPSEVSVSP
ncbi:MAG: septum formation initiator [Rhodospirillaceae bacterium]|nr:MAG: septum formation initiator [Rhodospirillaceae bacterium]